MRSITLNNQVQIPVIGYGVWKIEENIEECVSAALEYGYRHIDTAAAYGNEEGVGKAVRESGIPREEIFITTKLWNDDMRANKTKEAFKRSLEKLGLDYVDLYLIHWPVKDKYIDCYLEMEELYNEGLIRAIGVSNFLKHHLEPLLERCSVVPAVNQIQIHPRWTQTEYIEYLKQKNIAVEAYSPLGHGALLDNEIIKEVAERYNKTAAQVIIRWHLQRGVIVLPKTQTKERIKENIEVFDFELSDDDMNLISSLNDETCYGAHPDTFDF
ncbi:MAG: aldo/keto reductase [Clostridiales bacterium]|jgi:diketogulonate reductase-like aldo/keto reductase|nr:aldo/keto reductase [Clostridiales bacterium]